MVLSVVALAGSLGRHPMFSNRALGGPPLARTAWPQSTTASPRYPAPPSTVAPEGSIARGQAPSGPSLPGITPPRSASTGAASQARVVEVRVVGARRMKVADILRHIRTRSGRAFDAELIEEDVRRLYKTRKFVEVTPRYEEVRGGRVVLFEVLERPLLGYVKYVGNEKIKKKKLEKESGIKTGDAMDPFAVEEGRRRLEEFYRSKGYAKAQITVVEGANPSDQGAVYLINEGPKQRIGWTNFIGNTIATDAKLRTKIQSKPGVFWIFKGELNRSQIDRDVESLKDYYRSLGFFRAEVSRLPVDPTKTWQLMTFVINEGPRYEVSSISFEGNSRFSSEELARKLGLAGGDFFRRADMQSDLATIRDTYGAVGHIFADVNADITFHEEPGRLDLVYKIDEGKPYRVGRIETEILGDNPHTRITTVLNRLSLSPGDLIDIRELRASERRLKMSGLFEVDPIAGHAPQIVVRPPELEDMETSVASQPHDRSHDHSHHRGQSPDPTPHTAFRPPGAPSPSTADGVLDLCVQGRFLRDPQPVRSPEEEDGPEEERGLDAGPPRPVSGEPDVIRGQYSADAGRTIPSLRRPEPRLDPLPSPQFGGYLPPAETSSEPTYPQSTYPQSSFPRSTNPQTSTPQSTYPQPAYPQTSGPQPTYPQASGPPSTSPPTTYPRSTYPQPPAYSPPLGSAPYSQPLPSARPGPGASAPMSPTYGSQFGPAPGIGPPSGGGLAGPLSAGGSVFDDGYGLSGNPPYEDPPLYLPLNPRVYETRTGRLMFSAGVNSDAGLLGSVILDEQNFDWTRLPTSWEDIRDGTAWRGGGQRFRLEAVPGTQVQKYTANFTEPYLLDTPVSLGLSGYYYSRWYREWNEDRVGGRVALGYQFTHDLSGTLAFRGARIQVFDPIAPTPAELTEVLGSNALYGFSARLTHDTRDNAFLATEGHLFEASVERVIGSFDYTRGDIDFRKYFMLRQHPDGTSRHVMSLGARAAVTSDDTPIYEHYYAGGFSTLRGFDFRGASTRDPGTGVVVGGHFMMLASVEYLFPITADGNLRAVVFCDTGAVQPRIDEWTDTYRVSPGVGLRIVIPAMGAAPIALDFAFPVSSEPGDQKEVFSFFVGFLR